MRTAPESRVESSRTTGRLAKPAFRPDHDIPPSTERHTPREDATAISCASLRDTAESCNRISCGNRTNSAEVACLMLADLGAFLSTERVHFSKSTVCQVWPDSVVAYRTEPSAE